MTPALVTPVTQVTDVRCPDDKPRTAPDSDTHTHTHTHTHTDTCTAADTDTDTDDLRALPQVPTRAVRSGYTPDADTDAETTRLALAARDGDPVMVDRFVRALHRDVWRYVAYLSADRQAADDLTQEVFLRALAGLPRFQGRSSARTWLLSIARRTVVDSLRHAAARPRLADREDWQLQAERAQPRDLPGFDDRVALAELMSSISEERRDAFVLTQLLGLPYAEAAEAIGCPVGTVRSRVARARASLVALLRGEEEGTPSEAGAAAAGTAVGTVAGAVTREVTGAVAIGAPASGPVPGGGPTAARRPKAAPRSFTRALALA